MDLMNLAGMTHLYQSKHALVKILRQLKQANLNTRIARSGQSNLLYSIIYAYQFVDIVIFQLDFVTLLESDTI